MTVVAVDARFLLATDSGVWDNGMTGTCDKVFDLSAVKGVPAYAAGCGSLSAVTACINWLADGAVEDDWPEACKKDEWGEVLLLLPEQYTVLTFGTTVPAYGRLHPPLAIGNPAAAGAALHEMVFHKVDAVQALARVASSACFDSIRVPIRSTAEPSLPRPGEPSGLPGR